MSRIALIWRRIRYGRPVGLHRLAGVAALALGCLGTWMFLAPADAPTQDPIWRDGPPAAGRAQLATTALAEPTSAVAWSGSLPGDWLVNAQGQLQPSSGLRLRFDYLLTQRGDRTLAQMRKELQQRALLALGQAPADEVLALWDGYVKLQLWPWKSEVDLHQPATWRTALAERVRVRRDLLGPAWAQAFYGPEEQDLRRWIASRAGPETATSQAGLAPEAPRPMDREAEWKLWEQRLAQSRALLDRLQSAPGLSDEDRQIALSQHLDSHYQGGERQRAQAVLLSGAK